ncbi:MAG: LysR substrate-binding domain-containing protein, partial [Pseudomonadota bacterium]
SGAPMQGRLRLGIPDDHGRARLTAIIADFNRRHPKVELDVTCALSAGFPEALAKRRLDLAVYEVETPKPGEELLLEDPTCWVTAQNRDFSNDTTLPLALFDHACWWRHAALRSAEARGKPFRIAYSSQSVQGILAAVEAGIAVGLLGRSSLTAALSVADASYGFSATPSSKLVMASTGHTDTRLVATMKTTIRHAFFGNTATSGRKSQ